jgi:brefeldin A-inhibited guanine nucleotide-exchange protein
MENLNDQITKDAYLLFRAYCKLSMKPISGPESATDIKSAAMRSKILSLHLIHLILKDHPNVFFYPSPALFTVDMNAVKELDLAFVHSVRQYICLVFARNIVSIVPQVFDISMDIFGRLLLDLRFILKVHLD